VTLWPDTLARVTLWPVFLASFGVPKGEGYQGGTVGKIFEKKWNLSFLKSYDYFFQIFPYGPSYEIFIRPLVPQRKQEKLAKVSLWPKCL
jgi:hypothetical protein